MGILIAVLKSWERTGVGKEGRLGNHSHARMASPKKDGPVQLCRALPPSLSCGAHMRIRCKARHDDDVVVTGGLLLASESHSWLCPSSG